MVVAASGAVGALVGGPPGAWVGAGIGQRVGETGLAVLDAVAEATSWPWRIAVSGKRHEDQDVRQVLNAVNALIMALQAAYNNRLLLLVDGIDRVHPENVDRIRALFVDSTLLGELLCDAVWIAPGTIRGLDHQIRGFEIQELCNVPVLDRQDPTSPGHHGLEFFRSLVTKRVTLVREKLDKPGPLGQPVPPQPFPSEHVDRLAYYSGGLTRDFVRMIRMAAFEAWDADVDAITAKMVDFTLRETRRTKEAAMNSEEIELLERLMLDPKHELPRGDIAAKLVGQQRLLAYPNDTIWYYPHPLLTLALLKPERG
jgi:hypothetical protein